LNVGQKHPNEVVHLVYYAKEIGKGFGTEKWHFWQFIYENNGN